MPIHIKKPVQLIAKATPEVAAVVQAPKLGSKIIMKTHGHKPLHAPLKPPATTAAVVAPTPSKALPKPALKPSIKPTLRVPSLKPAALQTPALGLKPIVPSAAPKAPVEHQPSPTEGMSQQDQAAALQAGLISHQDLTYDQVGVKDRVIIINDMFPWVKHYKPGDRGFITKAANPVKDPLGLDDAGCSLWVIHIDQPTDKARLGQTACLFRKEFQLDKGNGVTNTPGKKVLMAG